VDRPDRVKAEPDWFFRVLVILTVILLVACVTRSWWSAGGC